MKNKERKWNKKWDLQSIQKEMTGWSMFYGRVFESPLFEA